MFLFADSKFANHFVRGKRRFEKHNRVTQQQKQPFRIFVVKFPGMNPTRDTIAMKLITKVTLCVALLASVNTFAQTSSGSVEDPLVRELNVFIPNAFTPNHDGHNDVFKPTISGPEIDVYELTIRNRDGDVVFNSQNPKEVWDGTTEYGDYTTSPTIYLYLLKVKSIEDLSPKLYRGHVVMIR